MNQIIIVGKLVEMPVIDKKNTGYYTPVVIEVMRQFKNDKGVFDFDLIKCQIWKSSVMQIKEHCEIGSKIAVQGRLATSQNESGEHLYEVIAEKVSIIQGK